MKGWERRGSAHHELPHGRYAQPPAAARAAHTRAVVARLNLACRVLPRQRKPLPCQRETGLSAGRRAGDDGARFIRTSYNGMAEAGRWPFADTVRSRVERQARLLAPLLLSLR